MQIVGPSAGATLIKNSVFSITMGANDYLNNYLVVASPTPRLYNPQNFQNLLISTFKQQLLVRTWNSWILTFQLPSESWTLPHNCCTFFFVFFSQHLIFLLCSAIDLPDLTLLLSLTASLVSRILQMLIESGARKFVISNVGALGCTPYRMTTNKTTGGTCVQSDNTLVSGFNTALKSLIEQLNRQFPRAKFILANAFDVLLSLRNNPATNGKSMSLLHFTCASKISIEKCFTKLCLETRFPKSARRWKTCQSDAKDFVFLGCRFFYSGSSMLWSSNWTISWAYTMLSRSGILC